MKKLNNNELKELHKRIGKNVKRYREENNISQLELSLLLNYKSVSTISNPEIFYKEKYKFNIEQLFLISKILKVPMERFLEE